MTLDRSRLVAIVLLLIVLMGACTATNQTAPPHPTPVASSPTPSASQSSRSEQSGTPSDGRPDGMPAFLHASRMTGQLADFSGVVWTDRSREADYATRAALRELPKEVRDATLWLTPELTIRARAGGSLKRLAPGAKFGRSCGPSAEGCYIGRLRAALIAVDSPWMSAREQRWEARLVVQHELGHHINSVWGKGDHLMSDEAWFRGMYRRLPREVQSSYRARHYSEKEVPEEVFADLLGLYSHAVATTMSQQEMVGYVGRHLTESAPGPPSRNATWRATEVTYDFMRQLVQELYVRMLSTPKR